MHDLRDAVRSLRSTPVVSLMAILSLALGIGANTAIFSIVDSLFLRTLPVRDPHQLVILRDAAGRRTAWSNPTWKRSASASASSTARSHGRARASIWRAVDKLRSSTACGSADACSTCWAYPPSSAARSPKLTTAAVAARRAGRGHQLWLLAAPLWRRRRRDRPHADRRTRAVHDHWRYPAAVLRRRRRSPFDVAIPIGTELLIGGNASNLDGRWSGWLNVMVRLKDGQSR